MGINIRCEAVMFGDCIFVVQKKIMVGIDNFQYLASSLCYLSAILAGLPWTTEHVRTHQNLTKLT